jgi:protein prenyltransferase alpha subunit repeat containing protein 1
VIHEVPSTADTDCIPETIPLGALEAEFVCASTACHLYPRNYHAWTHRHLCAKALVVSLHQEDPPELGVLFDEYQQTLEWIESHISDYSAMNHAINFERLLLGGKLMDGRLSTKAHAASLLRSYPDRESLWMYLRGSITDEDEEELLAPKEEDPSVQKFALRHTTWRKIFVS